VIVSQLRASAKWAIIRRLNDVLGHSGQVTIRW
jgi:hypothetical protein